MDYVRERGSIQADLALRAGRLLRQYGDLADAVPVDRRYDATLTIAVLNLLLANCKEAFAILERDGRTELLWPAVQAHLLETASSSFPRPTGGSLEAEAITHLRNAVSHPVPTRHDAYPVTGYTSFPDPELPHTVGGFEFTSSPWTDHRGVRSSFRSMRRSDVTSAFGRFAQRYVCVGLSVAENPDPDGYFAVVDDESGDAYLPVFRAKLSLPEVGLLAGAVANFLAHGSLASWDGSSLSDLLTA